MSNEDSDFLFIEYWKVTKDRIKHFDEIILKIRLEGIHMAVASEQNHIIAILTGADDRITHEFAYCDKLLTMKHGLMADRLTGKVRVLEEGGLYESGN